MRTISTLLVEDETLIRMMLAEIVEELGYLTVSEAANIEAAMSLAETGSFDLALLDINIAGSLVTPVVHILDRRSVPIDCFRQWIQQSNYAGRAKRPVACSETILARYLIGRHQPRDWPHPVGRAR